MHFTLNLAPAWPFAVPTICTANARCLKALKGLQLLVDGVEPETIRSVLEVDYMTQESRDIEAAKVFESMGGYAPTIGIIGAVMGLIHVMGNLADPGQLGSGIAVAFVAQLPVVRPLRSGAGCSPVSSRIEGFGHV